MVCFPEMTFEVVARLSTAVLSFSLVAVMPSPLGSELRATIICRGIGRREVADNAHTGLGKAIASARQLIFSVALWSAIDRRENPI